MVFIDKIGLFFKVRAFCKRVVFGQAEEAFFVVVCVVNEIDFMGEKYVYHKTFVQLKAGQSHTTDMIQVVFTESVAVPPQFSAP